MLRITLEPLGNFTELGHRWMALEQHGDCGFFRSWTFLGCQARQRFAQGQLLSVRQDGADVALGLMGRADGRVWLNQTGSVGRDAVFIEHNGLLAPRGHAMQVAPALRHAARACGAVVLSGVDDETVAAARQAGWLAVGQSRWAPCVDLRRLGQPFLETLSANARAQIRRSQRLYGPDLALARAATLEQAQAWFAEMAELHQAAWQRRGQQGAFAGAEIRAFHTKLVARAWPRDEVDLLRVTASGRTVGVLYNFVRDGRVSSYQSGFAYAGGDARAKPGLVSHALAIEHYAAGGAGFYDLLAGADRYKLTLAQGGEMLHWATVYRPWSGAGVSARLRLAGAALKALAVRR